MSSNINKFLTDYILCLKERTRKQKNGIVTGFDWIIYNLGIVRDWYPIRLPFLRQPEEDAAKTKSEAEFGIDLCFLSNDRSELLVFTLKAEVLNRTNWTSKKFDEDIRMATAPDLSSPEFESVSSVKIILAYNKDEDRNGIELFDRLVATMPTTIGDSISLVFERWNISRIVDEVTQSLISPDLLPQHLSGLFSYINSQVSDFSFSTKEWEEQLVPNWKSFLNILFQDSLDERKLRLIPIALLILYENKKTSPDSNAGWIDLIEWAMLSLWEQFRKTEKQEYKEIIIELWHSLYIAELERYLVDNSLAFDTEHGIHSRVRLSTRLAPINDAYIAFWHIGRVGILNLAPQDYIDYENDEANQKMREWVTRSSQWLISCLRNNPSTMRPLIDLHHIELYLIWINLLQAGRNDEIYAWLSNLETYLLVRRSGQANLPFIESRSRFDLVTEYATYNKRPSDFTDSSSYLLLMILELCLSLDDEQRDELLSRYLNRIVQGVTDDGHSFTETQIDLLGWAPPEDWSERILREGVYEGTSISTINFDDQKGKSLSERVTEYIKQSRERFSFDFPRDIPRAVYILACLKNKSPLPSEFWRKMIFPIEDSA